MSYVQQLIGESRYKAVKQVLSAPFIYAVFPGVVILHFLIEIYHTVCFPLYGIDYVDRREFLRIDRHKLRYLNWFEKLNCVYCGYVNGILPYMVEIAAKTENYWCAIKHEKYPEMKAPAHHEQFAEYGDEEGYRDRISHR